MDLSKRTVMEGSTALPPLLMALAQRMRQLSVLQDFEPNEANAIDYHKAFGHWLKPHVDDRQVLWFLHLQLAAVLSMLKMYGMFALLGMLPAQQLCTNGVSMLLAAATCSACTISQFTIVALNQAVCQAALLML